MICIAINACRQTVTLADLSNSKIDDEWVSPEAPGTNGEAFRRPCLKKAAEMVETHVAILRYLFGVPIAVAGEVNARQGLVQTTPIVGWSAPIDAARLVDELLGALPVLSTPPTAPMVMNVADVGIGLGQDTKTLATLNYGLDHGVGERRRSESLFH